MQPPSLPFRALFEGVFLACAVDREICHTIAAQVTVEDQTVTNLIWLFLVGLEGVDARTSVLPYVLEMYKYGLPVELLRSTTAALCDQKNLPKGVSPWTEELFDNENSLSIELLGTLFGENERDSLFAFCVCVVPANAQLIAHLLPQIFKFRCKQVDGDFDAESWDGYQFKGLKPYLSFAQREALRRVIIDFLDACPPTADVFHTFSAEQQLLILKRTSNKPNAPGCTVSAGLLMSTELDNVQQAIVTAYVSRAVTRPATCEDPGGAAAYVGLLTLDHIDYPGNAQTWAGSPNDEFVRELMRTAGNEFARLVYDGAGLLVATVLSEGLGRSLVVNLTAPFGAAGVWGAQSERRKGQFLLVDGDWVIIPRELFAPPGSDATKMASEEKEVVPARLEVYAATHPLYIPDRQQRLAVVYPAQAF